MKKNKMQEMGKKDIKFEIRFEIGFEMIKSIEIDIERA